MRLDRIERPQRSIVVHGGICESVCEWMQQKLVNLQLLTLANDQLGKARDFRLDHVAEKR
jgi:hypothetical protein